MKKPLLKAKTVPVSNISELDRKRMFSIMSKYYDEMSWIQFQKDLEAKTDVIVLRDRKSGVIQGFSTLLLLNVPGVRGTGVFSGDTIIEKEYWGDSSLGVEFLKYLWIKKLKNPFIPLYWLLISKGYKTYLIMANNFKEHYPRFEMQTSPKMKLIQDAFYNYMYPGKYDSASSRILFEKCEGKLKLGVAEVECNLLKENERVAFFEKVNPGWRNGDELACIATMSLLLPFRYQLKAIRKRSERRMRAAKPIVVQTKEIA